MIVRANPSARLVLAPQARLGAEHSLALLSGFEHTVLPDFRISENRCPNSSAGTGFVVWGVCGPPVIAPGITIVPTRSRT